MKIKLLLLLLICSATAYAQMHKEKGELTLKTGEVLSGTITYYYDNPKELSYYNGHEVKHTFKINEIQDIKLSTGEKFVSKTYKTEKDSITLILQSIIESASKISLYTRDDHADPYFYVEKNKVLHRLENNEIFVLHGNREYLKKDIKYIGTLGSLMIDRIDLVENLQKVKLNKDDLTKLLIDYNKGDITYQWQNNYKKVRQSNWVLFAQYSKYGALRGALTTAYSDGKIFGLQYYFSKSGRHSVKASLEHSNYNLRFEKIQTTGLGFRYEYSFVKSDNYGLYVMAQLFEITHFRYDNEESSEHENRLMLLPRFSPGIGIEAKPFPRTAVYAEINQLSLLKHVPKSFSLGVKYDFGNTTW